MFYKKDNFWYSKIKDYRDCPKLYELKHIQGIDLKSDSLDTEFGKALHLAINEILSKEGDGYEIFDIYWDSVKNKDLKQFRYNHKELGEMGPIFISKFERQHAKDFEPIHMEKRVQAQLGKRQFEGTPDFVGFYKGVATIADFKTSAKNYDKKKIISDEQMPGYAWLYEQQFGFKAKQLLYLVFVKDPKVPKIQRPLIRELTNVVQSSSIENVRSTCDEISSKTKFIKNTSHCVRGSIVCPAFKLCFPDGGNDE